MQIGSSFSNLTLPGRVICQFIVNGYGSQSVSITPVSGAMPSLGWLNGPVASRFQPGSVRNRYVKMERHDAEREMGDDELREVRKAVERAQLHVARVRAAVPRDLDAQTAPTSQPCALAMASGRQR